jgi:hypothetical protein
MLILIIVFFLYYPSTCFYLKTQRFGDWIPSPSSGKNLPSWAQSIQLVPVSGRQHKKGWLWCRSDPVHISVIEEEFSLTSNTGVWPTGCLVVPSYGKFTHYQVCSSSTRDTGDTALPNFSNREHRFSPYPPPPQ